MNFTINIFSKTLLTASVMVVTVGCVYGQTSLSNASQQATWDKAKTDSATHVDYLQLLNRLKIKIPALPTMANDPNRPLSTFQKNGTGSYYDAEGRVYSRSQWGHWTNYDNSKADNYVLPHVLKLNNGKLVTTAAMWWKQRRPEIVKDYETFVFGCIPKKRPK